MATTLPLISSTETQALNGSNFGPWYGPVYLENVMCNGTERFGFQCNTPGPGVITNQECYNPNRTAGVRCIASMWLVFHYRFSYRFFTCSFDGSIVLHFQTQSGWIY